MAISVTPTREVVCPGCGRARTITTRNARRNPQTCNLCRHPEKRKAPDDKDRRWWLRRFSDREIVDMATAMFESEGSIETVQYWRGHLLSGEKNIDVQELLIEKAILKIKKKGTHELLPRHGEAKLRQRVGSTAGA